MRRVHKLALEKKGWIGEGGEHSGWGSTVPKSNGNPFLIERKGAKAHARTETHTRTMQAKVHRSPLFRAASILHRRLFPVVPVCVRPFVYYVYVYI